MNNKRPKYYTSKSAHIAAAGIATISGFLIIVLLMLIPVVAYIMVTGGR